jgi:cytoplasmic iron level regulating protein YaaA (DUF328/UPF0246 family)
MKIIISPAKKLNENPCDINNSTSISFHNESQTIVNELKDYSTDKLISLMNVSSNIANLNNQRFNNWEYPFHTSSTKPAVFMFDGAVYNELDVQTLEANDLDYLQENLRIISGLYGLLKPLDEIMPYRLEMGTKLKINGYKNLYEFWGNKITDQLSNECNKEDVIVNLASNEYSKAINLNSFDNVLTPVFKDFKNGKSKVISFFAKKARGSFARFIVEKRPNKIEDLFNFNGLGYQFSEITNKNEIIFNR